MQGVKLCLQKLRHIETKYVHQMVKIKKENLVFSEVQEVKPTLGEEILAGRKFGGFGKNPPN